MMTEEELNKDENDDDVEDKESEDSSGNLETLFGRRFNVFSKVRLTGL